MKAKIHFLNTGSSDCILLESDKKFALIDAGEDWDYPKDKPHLNFKGYEDIVVDYLLKHCKGENNRVTLDFVVGTHAHSDHIGGFDTVINHPEIDVKSAFLKEYHKENIFVMENIRWDNQEVYDQMIEALVNNNVEIINNFDKYTFNFGQCKITFYNGEWRKRKRKYGENINSVVTLLECGDKKILLAGDLNYKDGDEKVIANSVGKVDVLKVGHHGYVGSTSMYWAKKLSPTISVITNYSKKIYPDVRFKLTNVAKSKIYTTGDMNGVLIEISNDNTIKVTENCMDL